MSFGLGRDRTLVPGEVGLTRADLPPLPDDLAANPAAARLDPRGWFPDPTRPLEIEIGSGKGTFLIQHAAAHPQTNFLGFEWAREFWLYACDRIRRRGLSNIRLLNGDATEFLHWRCPDGVATVIHLYFSDPWPKTRHHRRRVLQDRFLADAHRILVPGGELRIVTDHDEYWEWMREHFARWAGPRSDAGPMSDVGCGMSDGQDSAPSLTSDIRHPTSDIPFQLLPFQPPASAPAGELVGTNFERKYAREGRPFHAAILRRP
ncbi:MAG: tRNA (guanosine(46)-N7)-methyltransferase TrmB [Phycisphaerales bacterium]